MKKTMMCFAVCSVAILFACNKANNNDAQISLSASTLQATVGQTVTVTLTSSVNASQWTVTPSTAAKMYAVTTSKVNYITFNQPGVYTVAVSAKSVAYDSTAHQSLDSCWNHTGGTRHCVNGIDSASVKIAVTK